MLRATQTVRKPAVKADKVIDTVSLDHEGRHRRRVTLKGQAGTEFLLDLEKAIVLNDGDALKLEDGRLVLVKAAPQKLVEIRTENPARLMKAAWHIGNRHTPAEVTADAIYIEDDHVLVEMLRGLGCAVNAVERPFQPERGAYDQGGHGHHHHGHDHSHHDHHNHDHHAHGHDRHDHDHGCGCGHDHSHQHHHEVLDLKSKDHVAQQENACCGGGCGCGHDHSHQHHHEHLEKHAHDHGHDHTHSHTHDHSHGHAHKHG